MANDSALLQNIPEALAGVKAEHLFAMRLHASPPIVVSRNPADYRRVIIVTGGSFESRRKGLNGRVLEGGSDWQTIRPDRTTTLDVRLVLETAAGDHIGMTYRGLRAGPAEVLARLDRGEAVDPSDYYFRTVVQFDTASEKFAWLNTIVAIGIGHRFPNGPLYNVFAVL